MDIRLDAAIRMAQAGGKITLDYFNRPDLRVETKADLSPVTAADRAVEQCLRDRIREAFPEDGIVGEEYGVDAGTSGYTWTIDPIDGTKSFIHGVPLYGLLIACSDVDGPLLGVVYVPALGEMVYGIRGGGAFYKPSSGPVRPVTMRTTETLDRTAMVLTSGFEWATSPMKDFFMSGETMVRTWGDAYAWILLTTGRADAMIDHGIKEYDIAPLRVIIPEAGGAISVWQIPGRDDLAAIVSTKGLHSQLVTRFVDDGVSLP